MPELADPEDGAATGDPDWALLRRTAAGDRQAFRRLIEGNQGRLLAVCERMLGDPEEARDQVQEVFLQTYRQAKRLEPRGRLSTWLHRVAVNRCLNVLRRRRIVRFLSLDRPGSLEPPGGGGDEAPDPRDRVLARERLDQVEAALGRLPPGQRAVVVLVRLEGLSYRRAAEVLGVSVAAVEGRLFRALKTLRRVLEGPRGDAG